MTPNPTGSEAVSRCASVPVGVRRVHGFAVNIGGAQGGGEPFDAPKWSDLWDAFDDLRAQLAEATLALGSLHVSEANARSYAHDMEALHKRDSDEIELQRAELARLRAVVSAAGRTTIEVFVHSHFITHEPIGFDVFKVRGEFPAEFVQWLMAASTSTDRDVLDKFLELETEQAYEVDIEVSTEPDAVCPWWFDVLEVRALQPEVKP